MTSISKTIEAGAFAPVRVKRAFHWNAINGHRSVSPEPQRKRTRVDTVDFQREERTLKSSLVQKQQTVLLLHGKGQRYEITKEYRVPEVSDDHELLIKAQYIGLNPIDWKSA